jgi:anti-sigma regulatory factor (Ser/Thr protein kinase)
VEVTVQVAIRAYTFTNTVESVPKARRSVHKILRACKYDDDLIDTALLCTSELVTNAVMHATVAPTFTVLCRLQIDMMTIGVVDRDPRIPHKLDICEDDGFGRGLILVESLSDEWGIEARKHGKMVFARLKVAAPRTPAELHEPKTTPCFT